LTKAVGRHALFEDGSDQDVDAIVWATGYRPDLSWIDVPGVKGADGRIVHRRGVSDASGLFFLGLTWQHTRGSALIGFVNDDATYIASRIDPQQETRAGLVGLDSERT
jgi:putative flavoprotein involved in K+ transport